MAIPSSAYRIGPFCVHRHPHRVFAKREEAIPRAGDACGAMAGIASRPALDSTRVTLPLIPTNSGSNTTGSDTVTPITVSTNTAGTPITVGTNPYGIAITPDQASTPCSR